MNIPATTAWLLGLGGAAFLVASGMAERDQVRRSVDGLWYRYEQAVESAASAPQLGQQRDELVSLQQRADARLPGEDDAAAVLAMLGQQAAAAGLEVQSLEAADRQQREFYGVREVYLAASGSAPDAYRLMASQLAASPLRSISAVSLQRMNPPDGGDVRIALTIRFYDHLVAEARP